MFKYQSVGYLLQKKNLQLDKRISLEKGRKNEIFFILLKFTIKSFSFISTNNLKFSH